MGKVLVYEVCVSTNQTFPKVVQATHNIRCVVVPLGAGIDEHVLLSSEGSVVAHVVQGRRGSAARENGGVGLVFSTTGNAFLDEGGLKLSFVRRLLDPLQNGPVRHGRYMICLANKGHLVLVLEDPRTTDGILEMVEVLVCKFEKGDVVRDLIGNRIDGGIWVARAKVSQGGINFGAQLHFVDLKHFEGVIDADGQARPDNIVGVDGRDKQGGLVGLHVVDEVAVGEVAAGEVVEPPSLPWQNGRRSAGPKGTASQLSRQLT